MIRRPKTSTWIKVRCVYSICKGWALCSGEFVLLVTSDVPNVSLHAKSMVKRYSQLMKHFDSSRRHSNVPLLSILKSLKSQSNALTLLATHSNLALSRLRHNVFYLYTFGFPKVRLISHPNGTATRHPVPRPGMVPFRAPAPMWRRWYRLRSIPRLVIRGRPRPSSAPNRLQQWPHGNVAALIPFANPLASNELSLPSYPSSQTS
ncbi:uncharacterized protein CTRU02_209639 [Colletotrichum truncatum]|uniref:Uncharacterized protein n=1 Tax=Colletotrichum truncatum TaxID=5467 RepID=A0ACC3YSX9_COLTU|nr:uncharacterized protein CTRU02_12060 [Colletotrichum truncatum]KAF6785128.1 hypothetical protein CTRU02_12060 [Colletotrichum truncatum]